ncbi:MAG TPA: hypothetical protein VJU61_26155 [Polyangiaceae bacterium]|nr:hypothetical protein [Polyangiaceae bacterium]
MKDSCFDQHELGQEFRQAGQLLSSRQAFLACQVPSCPTAVRQDCSSWAADVDKQLPRVAFRVTLDGAPRADAQVSIDGQPPRNAGSTELQLDPGAHRYRVMLGDDHALEGNLQLALDEPVQRLDVPFHTAPAAGHPIPTLSWVLGGLGVAGAASFVGLGLSSRALERDLEQSCSPFCTEDQIDRVQQRALLANVSLGVGLTSLAAAAVVYFLSAPEPATEPKLELSLVRLDSGGAFAQLRLREF